MFILNHGHEIMMAPVVTMVKVNGAHRDADEGGDGDGSWRGGGDGGDGGRGGDSGDDD